MSSDISSAALWAWLRLSLEPGIGPASTHKLLAEFGSPEQALSAGAAALRRVLPTAKATQLAAPASPTIVEGIERTLRWAETAGHHILTWAHTAYPRQLLSAAGPPPVLFAQGQLEALETPALAIVGARHATPGGADNALRFAGALSRAGLMIVSGLAHGIDAAAHRGALDAYGLTLAVVGTGLDTVYPRDHASLAARITETGLIVSEYAPGTPAHAAHFPQRNRLIAGLSHGVLVVEAAVRSGSLITARLGIESGREVYAIPGSIHSPVARGCHALIRQGAKLVETAQDILEDLLPQLPTGTLSTQAVNQQATEVLSEANANAPTPVSVGSAHPLLDAMGFDPITAEALATRSGLPYEKILSQLFELEMNAAVVRLTGGRYERRRGS